MKPFRGSTKRRTLAIAALLVIVAALISGLTMNAVAGKSQEPQTAQSEITIFPTPTPTPFPGPTPSISETETATGYTLYLAGPETRGIEWLIAGKKIKLPEDAELGGLMIVDHSPVLCIVRGNSIVYIGYTTGKVTFCSIAQGEEGVFDFLKQAFPDQAEIVDGHGSKNSISLELGNVKV